MVERLLYTQDVVSSNLAPPTICSVRLMVRTPPFHGGNTSSNLVRNAIRGISSVGRASALQAECHRFESGYLHQNFGEVVELVDTADLKSAGGPSREGSSPSFATTDASVA